VAGKDVKISHATNLRFSQSKPDTRSSAKLSAPASLDWGKLEVRSYRKRVQAILRVADSLKWIVNFRIVDFRFSIAAKRFLTSHTSVGDIPTLLGDLDGRAQTVQT
jgi:hypothetical protein